MGYEPDAPHRDGDRDADDVDATPEPEAATPAECSEIEDRYFRRLTDPNL